MSPQEASRTGTSSSKWSKKMVLKMILFASLMMVNVVLSLAWSQEWPQPRDPYRLSSQDGPVYNDLEVNYNELHQNQHRGQYTCGRPMANKKLANLLFQGSSTSAVRPKYRPFEIRMPRIIGGDETNPGEFPWAVSVKLNGQPICGGSLIDNSWILTAAHCVVGYNPKNLTVKLGAYRIKDTSEPQTVETSLSLFVVHKQYSMPRPFSNDIALLKMSSPIEYSDFILPICLPSEDQNSTPTTSDLIDDFNTDFKNSGIMSPDGGGGGDSGGPFGNDLGGIVVSTKMSDKEISRCFKRLEQNYLNSIGMGSMDGPSMGSADVSTEEYTPTTHNSPMSSLPAAVANSLQSMHFQQHSQKAAIKLTSLPISNELLREIQSVGSLQSLQLGLQQGDIMAMASDLVASGVEGLPTGNAGNRERIVTTEGGSVGGGGGGSSSTRQSVRYPMRAGSHSTHSESISNEINDGKFSNQDVAGSKYSGELGLVVGWGWVRENDNDDQQTVSGTSKGYQSVTLQKVRLPILRNSDCEAWFRSQEKKITLLPSQFCAGYNQGGKDACRGDSGGPMIIEDSTNSGRFKLIGIVSAGIGCARPSLPGLYTRVASFLPWIYAQIQQVSR